MEVIAHVPAWIFGFGTCYAWMAYRKQVKGIFRGGELDLTRMNRLKNK